MLALKKLLYKILNKLLSIPNVPANLASLFTLVDATSASQTLAGGKTAWVSATCSPGANKTAIAMVGYYINGTTMVYPYAARSVAGGTGQLALRNTATSTVTFTVVFRFLVISKIGGVLRKALQPLTHSKWGVA